jgi:hypothetical protein
MIERPANRGLAAISVAGPHRRLVPNCLQRCKPTPQALFGQDREFDFGHIQPTGVLWRMAPNDAIQQSLGVLHPETLDQRLRVMRVELVEHHVNPASMGGNASAIPA